MQETNVIELTKLLDFLHWWWMYRRGGCRTRLIFTKVALPKLNTWRWLKDDRNNERIAWSLMSDIFLKLFLNGFVLYVAMTWTFLILPVCSNCRNIFYKDCWPLGVTETPSRIMRSLWHKCWWMHKGQPSGKQALGIAEIGQLERWELESNQDNFTLIGCRHRV